MKSKKALMGLAALLILCFHFYIPFSKNWFEILISKASYIGVDIFIFVSAYVLGNSGNITFISFIKNRIINIYIPFVIFSIIGMMYNKWPFSKFIDIITGKDFFERGGGAFLWYLTGVMIIYLITPVISYLKEKYKWKSFILLMIIWALGVFLIQNILNYKQIFILVNRLPIFLIGFYFKEVVNLKLKKFEWLFDIILLIIGGIIIYKYGTIIRLNKPIIDMYYLLAIPLVIAVVRIFEYIYNFIKIKPMETLGLYSLELYGLQMIFGYKIEIELYKLMNNGFLAFICTVSILFLASIIFQYILELFKGRV